MKRRVKVRRYAGAEDVDASVPGGHIDHVDVHPSRQQVRKKEGNRQWCSNALRPELNGSESHGHGGAP